MDFTTFSDQGDRDYNEDSVGIATHSDDMCFVLADGLGGHGGGEIASKTAIRVVCEIFEREGFSKDFFERSFEKVQEALFEEQYKANSASRMKTTLVVLVISAGTAYYAHVGDSRLYWMKDKHIKRRTIDHSVPQMLALSGEIKESEIRHHPDRNRLMRVMGVEGEKARPEIGKPIKIKGDTVFLLCSDGYWELIEEKDIEFQYACSSTLEEWVKTMNEIINKNGANMDMDNYSVVAVHIKTKRFF